MSATGRSDVREKDDFYQTPTWVTRALLKRVGPHVTLGKPILDLGCGSGAIGFAIREWWGSSHEIVGVDFHEGRLGEARTKRTRENALVFNEVVLWDVLNRFETQPINDQSHGLIISNPPFKHAFEFLEIAHRLVAEGGTVAFLLRLAWIASAKRAAWHRANPCELCVLPERAGFYPDRPNDKDSADYAWFVWGGAARPGTYTILDAFGAPAVQSQSTAVVTESL